MPAIARIAPEDSRASMPEPYPSDTLGGVSPKDSPPYMKVGLIRTPVDGKDAAIASSARFLPSKYLKGFSTKKAAYFLTSRVAIGAIGPWLWKYNWLVTVSLEGPSKAPAGELRRPCAMLAPVQL